MNMNKQNLLASLNHFVSSKQQQKALQLQLLTLDEHLLKWMGSQCSKRITQTISLSVISNKKSNCLYLVKPLHGSF